MSYSLKQAADATGKDRSTIQRAIKSGRISATLGESGAYKIDPAELHRVFPPVVRNEAQPITMQQNATDEIASENRELKAKVDLLREMVDDLRQRLDKSEDERRATQTKLTALLTHQQQPQQAANQNPRRSFWAAFLAGLVVLLLIAAILAASSLRLLWKQPG
jgi:FtsZ-binding cell division protein ZapB